MTKKQMPPNYLFLEIGPHLISCVPEFAKNEDQQRWSVSIIGQWTGTGKNQSIETFTPFLRLSLENCPSWHNQHSWMAACSTCFQLQQLVHCLSLLVCWPLSSPLCPRLCVSLSLRWASNFKYAFLQKGLLLLWPANCLTPPVYWRCPPLGHRQDRVYGLRPAADSWRHHPELSQPGKGAPGTGCRAF